jgi:hypothetical protein
MLKIEIFNKLDENLLKIWNEFEDKNNLHFYSSLYWLKKCTEAFKNKKIIIAVVFNDNEVVMIMPFQIKIRYHLKFLEWIGDEVVDFMGPIIDSRFDINKSDFIKLWTHLLKAIEKVDIIFLNKQLKFFNNKKNPFVFFLSNNFKENIYIVDIGKKMHDYYFEKDEYFFKSKKFELKKLEFSDVKFTMDDKISDSEKDLLDCLDEEYRADDPIVRAISGDDYESELEEQTILPSSNTVDIPKVEVPKVEVVMAGDVSKGEKEVVASSALSLAEKIRMRRKGNS